MSKTKTIENKVAVSPRRPLIGSTRRDWEVAQKPRWDNLAAAGWLFARPPKIDGFFGLRMKRENTEFIFYVQGHISSEQIHTQILILCERAVTI